jgi:S-DNA-T family DNA segregation ATPase FtsK/SpoIIIE
MAELAEQSADDPRRHLHAVDTPPEGLAVDDLHDTGPAAAGLAGDTTVPDDDPDPFEAVETTPPARPLPQVVPGWARSREAFTTAAREVSYRVVMVSAFHASRSPLYWVRCLPGALRTIGRMLRRVYWFATDVEGRRLRRELSHAVGVGRSESVAFHGVTQQHRGVVRERLLATAVLAGMLGLAATVAWVRVPHPTLALAGVVAVPVLAWFSRTPDQKITSTPAGRLAPPPAFDRALITQALISLGNSRLTAGLKAEGLTLVAPICRDGAGWRADIDLPNVPASEVCEQRARLAAGLRRPRACVWPTADPDAHEARLVLWVGDRARSKAPQPWVLAKSGKVDLFKAFPVGTNPQGRPVTLCLMFASMIIGAVPRIGKTFCLRLILLAAALDVTAELHTYDLKGADLRPLGLVSHRHRCGLSEETIEYLARDMSDVRKEMDRRYQVILSLPEHVCPEGKITPELVAKRNLRLWPLLVAIDETHLAFEHPEYGKQIEEDVTDIARRGPAVGIIDLLATQRPDSKSIPPAISSNAILRLCLWVKKWQVSDMVLGDGMHSQGFSGLMFNRSDRGTGWLAGEGEEPEVVTFGYVDAPTAKAIALRARAARQAAGTLTGYAVDLDLSVEPDDSPTLLDDLAAVMTPGEKVWSDILLERLVTYRAATYTGWTPTDLGNTAAAYGLSTIQIGRREAGKVTNRRGFDQTDILKTITQRDDGRGA